MPRKSQTEKSAAFAAARDAAAPAALQGAALQIFLRRKLRLQQNRRQRYKIGMGAISFTAPVLVILCGIHGSAAAAFFFLFVLPLLLVALFLEYHVLTRKAIQVDIEEIAQLAGVQAIGTLFEMLRFAVEPQIAAAIRRALTRLLPQMNASDANLLTPYARRTIHGWLNAFSVAMGTSGHLNKLRVAALKALEHVGDSRDIPIVMRLTKMNLRVCDEWEVQQAAAHCLPLLQANCGEVEAARTLLRASQTAGVRPDTLLRPASGAGHTDAAELLRGANLGVE